MKLEMFAKFAEWRAAHPGLAAVIMLLLAAALCAGGYFGWRTYTYRQSSQYAFEELHKALAPPDPHALANMVDFRSLGADLGSAIAESFPFYMAGDGQVNRISHKLQTGVLRQLLSKPASSPATETDEEAQLQKALEILPPDFAEQLISGMSFRDDGDMGYITARIDNPLLKSVFTIILTLEKTSSGWKVRHVANAKELVAQVREAMLDRFGRQREVFVRKNALTGKRMQQMLPILSCTADAGLLSDGKTLVMVVRVLARNHGDYRINNFNLDLTLAGPRDQPVVQRRLNAALPLPPGEDFDHRWNFELEASSDLGQKILANQPLRCSASWRTLGVDNSEVLHIMDLPHPDRYCQIEGHKHPDGFCTLPVFQN